jgi:hypothetical protein
MGRSKKQTRIAFNPLPTSSPTTSAIIKEYGQRNYAAVGLEGSQRLAKRSRVTNNGDEDNDKSKKISISLARMSFLSHKRHVCDRNQCEADYCLYVSAFFEVTLLCGYPPDLKVHIRLTFTYKIFLADLQI